MNASVTCAFPQPTARTHDQGASSAKPSHAMANPCNSCFFRRFQRYARATTSELHYICGREAAQQPSANKCGRGRKRNVDLGEFQQNETKKISLNCTGSMLVDSNPTGRLNLHNNALFRQNGRGLFEFCDSHDPGGSSRKGSE